MTALGDDSPSKRGVNPVQTPLKEQEEMLTKEHDYEQE
jgi:hypothetical protein